MKKIIIFAPHPDDETLACGGTIALRLRQGYEVHIVFMTDGRNSHLHGLGIASNPTPSDLKMIRKEEAKRATSILGVKGENLIFLDFEDRMLKTNTENAVKEVKKILDGLQPCEVYCPNIKDKHPDHRATNEIVRESLLACNLCPRLYEYRIWLGRWDRYCAPSTNRQVTVDILEVLPIKKKAIEEYESQTTMLSPQQKHPVLTGAFLGRFLRSTEVFIKSQ